MSRKVGMPWMKLDSKSYSTSNEHHGNNKAIMCEAMEERWSSDPDLDRDLTPFNVYGGYRSGLELLNDINHEIEDLSASLREQGKRGIRKDAITSFALIIKPDTEIMDGLTKDQQMQFFRDAFNIVSEKFGYNQQLNKKNIRAFTIHFDEGNPHMHLFGVPYTADGRLSAKEIFTPQLSRWLNEEFPKLMNEKGWELEPCKDLDGYNPDKAKELKNDIETAMQSGDEQAITEAETALETYKEQCIEHKKAKRKQRGKTSKEFKEAKEIEKAVQEAVSNADPLIQQAIQEAREEAYKDAYEEASKVYKAEMEKQLKTAQNELKSVVAGREDMIISYMNDAVTEYRNAVTAHKEAEQTPEVEELRESLKSIKYPNGKTGLDFHQNRMAKKAQMAEKQALEAERQREQRIKEIQRLEQLSETDGLTDQQQNQLNSLYQQRMMSGATEALKQREYSPYQQKVLDKVNRQIQQQSRQRSKGWDIGD